MQDNCQHILMQSFFLLLLTSALPLTAAQKNLAVLQQDGSITAQKITAQEVFFTSHQKQVLGQDLPLRDLALSQRYLWLLGSKHVWHFDLRSQRLRKFTFPLPTKALANAFLARDENEQDVYFATSRQLFKLRDKPQLVKRLPRELTKVVAFNAMPAAFVWFSETGVYFLQRPTHRLWRVPYQVQRGDVALAAPRLDAIWLVRGKSLLRVAGEKWQEEAILKAPDLALGSSDKSLFIGRGNAVLHYAWSGHLTQAIPIAQQRHLRAMHIAPHGHSYIFADGLLEHYRPKTKTVLRTRLKLRPQTHIAHLDVFSSRLAFIASGMARLFVLQNKTRSEKAAKSLHELSE